MSNDNRALWTDALKLVAGFVPILGGFIAISQTKTWQDFWTALTAAPWLHVGVIFVTVAVTALVLHRTWRFRVSWARPDRRRAVATVAVGVALLGLLWFEISAKKRSENLALALFP